MWISILQLTSKAIQIVCYIGKEKNLAYFNLWLEILLFLICLVCESWLLHLYKEAAARRGSYRRGTTRRDEAVVVTVAAHHNENIPNPDQDQDLPPSYEEVQMRNMNNVE